MGLCLEDETIINIRVYFHPINKKFTILVEFYFIYKNGLE